jgi:hypothetical protein
MKNYRVTIIRRVLDREVEFCIPIRGENEEDVRQYVENEFIPEMAKGRTSLCIYDPNAVYCIEKITHPRLRGKEK